MDHCSFIGWGNVGSYWNLGTRMLGWDCAEAGSPPSIHAAARATAIATVTRGARFMIHMILRSFAVGRAGQAERLARGLFRQRGKRCERQCRRSANTQGADLRSRRSYKFYRAAFTGCDRVLIHPQRESCVA